MANTILCDSDFAEDVTIQDEDGGTLDISTWTFEFACAPEDERSNCRKFSLTMGSGLSIQDGPNGVLRISMTYSQTKDFGPGVGRILLWRTDGMRKIIGEGIAVFEGKRFDA